MLTILPKDKNNSWHQNVMDALVDKGVNNCVDLSLIFLVPTENDARVFEVRQSSNGALMGTYRIG